MPRRVGDRIPVRVPSTFALREREARAAEANYFAGWNDALYHAAKIAPDKAAEFEALQARRPKESK